MHPKRGLGCWGPGTFSGSEVRSINTQTAQEGAGGPEKAGLAKANDSRESGGALPTLSPLSENVARGAGSHAQGFVVSEPMWVGCVEGEKRMLNSALLPSLDPIHIVASARWEEVVRDYPQQQQHHYWL